MKIILKILLLSCLLINTTLELEAQTQRKRFTTDFHIGLNFAEMDINGGANDNNKPKLGMHLGMNFNYKILHNIQIQTGFFVTKKGLKQEIHKREVDPAINDVYVYDTINHTVGNYMQIPLCLGYEVYLSKKFAFNLNAGLYVAYGYKGTYENKQYFKTISSGGAPVENPVEIYTGETFDLNKWRRWDYGAIGSVGFIYDIFMLNFNYEHGFYNISSKDEITLKNRNMSVSLGFRF